MKNLSYKLLVVILLILVLSFQVVSTSNADYSNVLYQKYKIVNMLDGLEYLKDISSNSLAIELLGGFAPCEGTLKVLERVTKEGVIFKKETRDLIFEFYSNATGNSIAYLIADSDTFLETIQHYVRNKGKLSSGHLGDAAIDLNDGTRSNYVLSVSDQGDLLLELDRANIDILFVMDEAIINVLL